MSLDRTMPAGVLVTTMAANDARKVLDLWTDNKPLLKLLRLQDTEILDSAFFRRNATS